MSSSSSSASRGSAETHALAARETRNPSALAIVSADVLGFKAEGAASMLIFKVPNSPLALTSCEFAAMRGSTKKTARFFVRPSPTFPIVAATFAFFGNIRAASAVHSSKIIVRICTFFRSTSSSAAVPSQAGGGLAQMHVSSSMPLTAPVRKLHDVRPDRAAASRRWNRSSMAMLPADNTAHSMPRRSAGITCSEIVRWPARSITKVVSAGTCVTIWISWGRISIIWPGIGARLTTYAMPNPGWSLILPMSPCPIAPKPMTAIFPTVFP